jgi:hypothetical protein
LWLSAASPALEASQLDDLENAGVGELFVEAAALRWEEGQPTLEKRSVPSLPRRTQTTLVVGGGWADLEDPWQAAQLLAAPLFRLKEEAEERRMAPLGFHFDLSGVENVESYASFLSALRRQLGEELVVSATLPSRLVGRPEAGELANAVDYLVVFLYGQRPGQMEEAAAWDFRELEKSLQELELLEVPYMIGVVTVGTASHLGSRRERLGQTTEANIRGLLRNPRLGLDFGFPLRGVDRQVYTFEAHGPMQLGSWRMRSGDRVRVVSTASFHLEELVRVLGASGVSRLLGQVYYRLPAAAEGLSLSLVNLLDALGPERAGPELEVEVERVGGSRWTRLLRIRIRNLRAEATELGLVDHNYVQLTARRGSFGTVKTGEFDRYDLLRRDADGELVRTLKEPEVLRLYLAYLGSHEEISSGAVQLRRAGGGRPSLLVEASFLEPGGRTVTYGPTEWSG